MAECFYTRRRSDLLLACYFGGCPAARECKRSPLPKHFWHIVDDVALGWFEERPCGAYLDISCNSLSWQYVVKSLVTTYHWQSLESLYHLIKSSTYITTEAPRFQTSPYYVA